MAAAETTTSPPGTNPFKLGGLSGDDHDAASLKWPQRFVPKERDKLHPEDVISSLHDNIFCTLVLFDEFLTSADQRTVDLSRKEQAAILYDVWQRLNDMKVECLAALQDIDERREAEQRSARKRAGAA
jgi:hypothetical protein